MGLATKIVITASTVPTILIVFGCLFMYTGFTAPSVDSEGLIDMGWKLVGIGIVVYLVDLMIFLVLHERE